MTVHTPHAWATAVAGYTCPSAASDGFVLFDGEMNARLDGVQHDEMPRRPNINSKAYYAMKRLLIIGWDAMRAILY